MYLYCRPCHALPLWRRCLNRFRSRARLPPLFTGGCPPPPLAQPPQCGPCRCLYHHHRHAAARPQLGASQASPAQPSRRRPPNHHWHHWHRWRRCQCRYVGQPRAETCPPQPDRASQSCCAWSPPLKRRCPTSLQSRWHCAVAPRIVAARGCDGCAPQRLQRPACATRSGLQPAHATSIHNPVSYQVSRTQRGGAGGTCTWPWRTLAGAPCAAYNWFVKVSRRSTRRL